VDRMVVQLLRDHPGTIALVAAASALFGAVVTAIVAHLVHRVRSKQLLAEIAKLKEQRGRRIEEFTRLAPGIERRAPGPSRPTVGGEADVTDRMRIDRSD
jgi:hypothetical protein